MNCFVNRFVKNEFKTRTKKLFRMMRKKVKYQPVNILCKVFLFNHVWSAPIAIRFKPLREILFIFIPVLVGRFLGN